MRHTILLLAALTVFPLAAGQALTFAEVKAKNAVQLTATELRELMPDAKVVSRTPAGSSRRWTNKPDGTFVASSDGRGSSGGRNITGTGNGTWRVTDDGRLCVTIKWTTNPDDWCRFMFKADDGKYYGFGRREDNAVASEFEFSK